MDKKTDIRNMLKDAIILFVITLISGVALGYVYELTKEPIRIQQELAIQKACQAVFEEAGQFEEIDYVPSDRLSVELAENDVSIGGAYHALGTDGTHLGFVVEATSSEGYGGNITLYMGVTDDGILNGISILQIAETPGLGMKADEVLTPQFQNKQVEYFTYTKSGSTSDSEIDAISGATVTTKALVNAVNGGMRAVAEELHSLMTDETAKEGGNSK